MAVHDIYLVFAPNRDNIETVCAGQNHLDEAIVTHTHEKRKKENKKENATERRLSPANIRENC